MIPNAEQILEELMEKNPKIREEYLTREDRTEDEICMSGFVLKNTLSDNGTVTRGICNVDDNGMLSHIVETKNIAKTESGAVIRKDEGDVSIDADSHVSMNMWGLYPEFFQTLEEGFLDFLTSLEETDLKSEYLLPIIIGDLLDVGKIQVKVLESADKWFGVTYKEDKATVVEEIRKLIEAGIYPEKLYS